MYSSLKLATAHGPWQEWWQRQMLRDWSTKRLPCFRFRWAAALGLVFSISVARAVIITLPSTGTDANNNVLAGGSSDLNYTVTGPGITGSAAAVVYSSANIWYQWAPNDAHSGWIGFRDTFSSSPY